MCRILQDSAIFLEMFERNPLAVKDGFLIWDRRFLTVRRGETQSQIPSVCATCGLTQKQSLRGLLLRHQVKLQRLGVTFCHNLQDD